mgnify:CR=1 FL=1
MSEVEVTWGRAVRVWWSLVWRTVLFGVLAGLGVGFVFSFLGSIAGMSQGSIFIYSTIAGYATGIPIGIWVLKTVLSKRFSDFRLALISTN